MAKFNVIEIDDDETTRIVAQYVDNKGRRLNQEREFVRTPGKIFGFWDDDDVIILDLNDRTGFNSRISDKGTLFEVEYDGKAFMLDFSATSAKERRLPLVNKEKRVASHYMKYAEQSAYGQRFFLASARRAIRGSFSVGVKPENYELASGDIVADGMGYISQSLWEALIGKAPIKLTTLENQPRDSYQLYRMPWASIKDEALPLLEKSMASLLESTSDFYRSVLAGDEEKITILGAEPEMADHPLLVNAFTRESRMALAAKSYSVPFEQSHYKLAMPVKMPADAGPVAFLEGKWVLGRYPFSSNAALRAYQVGDEAAEIYEERVAGRQGIQYSLFVPTDADKVQFGAKGMMIVVPDRWMEGYDLIICDKDIKLVAIGGTPVPTKKASKMTKFDVADGYLGAIQIYGQGAFVGITPEEWIGFPGDFDGDGAVIYGCEGFPSFYEAIRNLPRKPMLKIANSQTPYNQRAVSIKAWQVMNSYIGQLSNIMSTTFAVEDRGHLAKQMGFRSAEAMDERISYLMQIEVDRLKKNTAAALASDMKRLRVNDPDRTMGMVINILERNLTSALSRLAPWTGWKRTEDTFKFFVPQVWHKGLTGLQEEEAIPMFWNGAVAEMLKFTLPRMASQLALAATVRPLGYYYNWASPVSPELEKTAKAVVHRFARELISLNHTDPNATDLFKDRWQTNMSLWEDATGFKAEVICSALWRASHSTDSQFSSAVCPFWCYPKEALRIVIEKPGLSPVRSAKVIGLRYRIPTNGGPDLLERVEVTIEDIKIEEVVVETPRSRLARIIRAIGSKEIPLNPEGMTRKGYPRDYLAEVPFDGVAYPPTGKHLANFRRVSKGAWVMELKDL